MGPKKITLPTLPQPLSPILSTITTLTICTQPSSKLISLLHLILLTIENNLIKSILSYRYQFAEIDGFQSNVTPSNPCSVLQGSKLSSLLYTLYCNEIPLLYKLIGSPLSKNFTKIPDNFNTKAIHHKIVQYVDDSTNIIATNDTNQLQSYINLYFSILEEFYNVNKLLINSDKSKLLLITKPNLRQIT